ncbi:MAG: hypothetical protein ABIT07_12665 [Ferruginibacter sp.]
MAIKKESETRKGRESFILSFYEKVIPEETLGIIFTETVPLLLGTSYLLITDF